MAVSQRRHMQNYVDKLKTKPTEVMVTDNYLCLSADDLITALKLVTELRNMGTKPELF